MALVQWSGASSFLGAPAWWPFLHKLSMLALHATLCTCPYPPKQRFNINARTRKTNRRKTNVPIPFMPGLSLFRFSNSTISTFSRNSKTDVKNALVPQNLKDLDPSINFLLNQLRISTATSESTPRTYMGLAASTSSLGTLINSDSFFVRASAIISAASSGVIEKKGASKRARSTFKKCPVVIQVSCPLSLMFGCTLLARPSSTYFTILSVALMMSESNIVKALSRDFSPCRFPFD